MASKKLLNEVEQFYFQHKFREMTAKQIAKKLNKPLDEIEALYALEANKLGQFSVKGNAVTPRVNPKGTVQDMDMPKDRTKYAKPKLKEEEFVIVPVKKGKR